MTDRNVQYPNRFHVKPVPGTDDICEIIPAPGTVYEDGTFWNKANVLQDAVAALYGKDAAATPNDIFAAIRPLISAAQSTANGRAKIYYGSYVGTGSYGINNPNSLYFGFDAKIVFIFGHGASLWCIRPDSSAVPWGLSQRFATVEMWPTGGISWYSTTNSVYQLNDSVTNYYYVAIG